MTVNMTDQTIESIIEREKIYSQLIEQSSEIIIIHQEHQVLYINESGAQLLKGTKEEIIGASVLSIIKEEYKESIKQRIHNVMTENKSAQLIEQTMLKLDGTPIDVEVNCSPILYGTERAVQSVLRDITPRREAEKKQRALIKEINTVSATVVPVSEGISILPLVGSIDSDRAKQLADDIPKKVKDMDVQFLIIDFSGLYNVDHIAIDYLLRISATMKLLGIQPIMTGLRAELAHQVVDLGVDLTSLRTMATVQQAVALLTGKTK